jgi:hypothetical protein
LVQSIYIYRERERRVVLELDPEITILTIICFCDRGERGILLSMNIINPLTTAYLACVRVCEKLYLPFL